MDSWDPFCVPSPGIYHPGLAFCSHTASLSDWAQHFYVNLPVLGLGTSQSWLLRGQQCSWLGGTPLWMVVADPSVSGLGLLLLCAALGLRKSGLQIQLRHSLCYLSCSLSCLICKMGTSPFLLQVAHVPEPVAQETHMPSCS